MVNISEISHRVPAGGLPAFLSAGLRTNRNLCCYHSLRLSAQIEAKQTPPPHRYPLQCNNEMMRCIFICRPGPSSMKETTAFNLKPHHYETLVRHWAWMTAVKGHCPPQVTLRTTTPRSNLPACHFNTNLTDKTLGTKAFDLVMGQTAHQKNLFKSGC